MQKIKSFNQPGLEGIVYEIKKYLKEHDSEIAIINCAHMGSYNSKNICPICKKRWNRIPREEVFRDLTSLYNATDTAWATLFGTNRSSVSKLRNKFNPKDSSLVWNQKRLEKEKNEYKYIDKEPIYDFFKLLEKYPRSSESELLKIGELNKNYLNLILDNFDQIKEDYKNIKELRKSNTSEYQFCSKCKIRKRRDKFIIINSDNLIAKICMICADENVKEYQENSSKIDYSLQPDLADCKECGEKFDRRLIKKEGSILFCDEHQTII